MEGSTSQPARSRGHRPLPERREPQRTCVGCRGAAPKRSLVRLVRRVDGTVGLDPTGRAPGRGAYVHADRACAERAVRSGALGRALRTPLERAEAARLMNEAVEERT